MTSEADGRAALVQRFYDAFIARDWNAVRACFADVAELGFGGRSPLAGHYEGADAAVAALRDLVDRSSDLVDRSSDSLRPALDDGSDICVSAHHVLLFDWFRAERAGRELKAYLYFVVAAEDGHIVRMFVHSSEQYEFDEFFAEGS